MEPAVFLDRDNTLIANDGDLGEPEQVRLLQGVAEGLGALRGAGYRLVVVTNQAGVARGSFSEDDVDAVHQRIAALVDAEADGQDLINRFYYCPYHPEAPLDGYRRDHPWRKPHPGMLLQAARDLGLDLDRCWMIGDQARDVEAGRAAGCRTILVSRDDAIVAGAAPTAAVPTFAEAVRAILQETPPRDGNPGHERGTTASPESAPPAPGAATDAPPGLREAIDELTRELRTEHQRRAEFTGFRLAAGMCQLLALLLALLGLLQLGSTDAFMKWMVGAALAQMMTISILLLDLRG